MRHVTSPACRAAPTAPGTRWEPGCGAGGATAPLGASYLVPARSRQSVQAKNRPGVVGLRPRVGAACKGKGGWWWWWFRAGSRGPDSLREEGLDPS